MLPAISLGYEKSESDVMSRPPRNLSTDRLASWKSYYFGFFHTGIIETSAGFFSYFMIMGQYGFLPSRLIGIYHAFYPLNMQNLYKFTKFELVQE